MTALEILKNIRELRQAQKLIDAVSKRLADPREGAGLGQLGSSLTSIADDLNDPVDRLCQINPVSGS